MGGEMVEVYINKDEITKTAEIFKQAGEETEAIALRLEKQMEQLSETWQDVNGETFYQFYAEWSKHIGGFSEALYVISQELGAIAEQIPNLE